MQPFECTLIKGWSVSYVNICPCIKHITDFCFDFWRQILGNKWNIQHNKTDEVSEYLDNKSRTITGSNSFASVEVSDTEILDLDQ